jgi:hypothetical protein
MEWHERFFAWSNANQTVFENLFETKAWHAQASAASVVTIMLIEIKVSHAASVI